MNTHLNNFLDECEGLPKNTSNNAIKREIERQRASGYTIQGDNGEDIEFESVAPDA